MIDGGLPVTSNTTYESDDRDRSFFSISTISVGFDSAWSKTLAPEPFCTPAAC
jgi:hypothetical protein